MTLTYSDVRAGSPPPRTLISCGARNWVQNIYAPKWNQLLRADCWTKRFKSFTSCKVIQKEANSWHCRSRSTCTGKLKGSSFCEWLIPRMDTRGSAKLTSSQDGANRRCLKSNSRLLGVGRLASAELGWKSEMWPDVPLPWIKPCLQKHKMNNNK